MGKTGKDGDKAGLKVVAKNRRATFDYLIERKLEAGIALLGTEVKSLRDGGANLSDSYAAAEKGEIWLHNCSIAPYKGSGPLLNHEPLRKRKLLLHGREIDDLSQATTQKGYTLVPLSIYFKEGVAKVELGVGRGKTHGDRREAITERETKREIDRALRQSRKPGRR